MTAISLWIFTLGSYKGIVKDSSILGCYATLAGKYS